MQGGHPGGCPSGQVGHLPRDQRGHAGEGQVPGEAGPGSPVSLVMSQVKASVGDRRKFQQWNEKFGSY